MATISKNGKRMGRPPKQTNDTQALALGKALLHAQARYDAAGTGRRLAGWTPPSTGPNTAQAGIERLTDRSRDAVRNDWSASAVQQKWATNLIGVGITPRFTRVKSKTRRREITDLWDDFSRQADADCVLNVYGLQSLAVKSWVAGGEVFARRRQRPLGTTLPVPMQVQLIESEMLPRFDADTFVGLPEGNRIRSGIERNRRNERVAYWFYREHPNDKSEGREVSAELFVRVPARDVAHIYEPSRPGELRGVSILAPVLARLRNINDYEDATLERQKLANLFVAFLTKTSPEYDPDNPNSLTGGTDKSMEGDPLIPLSPGVFQELDEGEKVEFSNPPEAGTSYSEYMRTNHLATASGAGLPYELLSGDIKEVSDRTLRVLINEFRRLSEQRQWQMVIPQFCEKVVQWFADAGVLAGKVELSELDDIRRATHAPHGWAYIHPVQDVQGKKMEVENGFRSRSDIIGERGDDPETVDEERAVDMAREKEMGLYIDPMGGFGGDEGAVDDKDDKDDGDDDDIDDNEYSAPPNPSMQLQLQQRQMDRVNAEIDLLKAKTESLLKPKIEAKDETLNRILNILGDEHGGD